MSDHASEGGSPAEPVSEFASSAEPDAVARLVNLDSGLFTFSITGVAPSRGAIMGLALPAVHVSPLYPGRDGAVEITTASGKPGAWLDERASTLFVRSPPGGMIALVTAYVGRDPSGPPLALAIRRLDAPAEPPVTMVSIDLPTVAARRREIGLEIVLHIRGRGDVYFFDSEWAGRLGSGLSVEAFTILPRQSQAAAALEYKGLTARGIETPWLPSGSACGTSGRNIPLLGFAVRQKAGTTGARFDCEYSGHFQSGTTSGPFRNGAPCLSPVANDPLEGLRLRIVDRSGGQ